MIYSERNLYPGINIHLNSILQNDPGTSIWQSFHAEYIVRLRETMDINLPRGYFTLSETSLQIGEFDAGTGLETRARTTPDVTIYRNPTITGQTDLMIAEETSSPTLVLPLPETLKEEETLTGLIIYQAGEGSFLGRPITRIELLSPANKPGGTHYEQYILKRLQTLKSGLRLVEIDYLHQTAPIIYKLPRYPKGKDSFPYMIIVTDPRPTFEEGKTAIYAIHVDQALPILDIPLAGADVVRIRFGDVYNRTFESSRFFLSVVDYATDPVHMDTYSKPDQERIKNRLSEIRAKQIP